MTFSRLLTALRVEQKSAASRREHEESSEAHSTALDACMEACKEGVRELEAKWPEWISELRSEARTRASRPDTLHRVLNQQPWLHAARRSKKPSTRHPWLHVALMLAFSLAHARRAGWDAWCPPLLTSLGDTWQVGMLGAGKASVAETDERCAGLEAKLEALTRQAAGSGGDVASLTNRLSRLERLESDGVPREAKRTNELNEVGVQVRAFISPYHLPAISPFDELLSSPHHLPATSLPSPPSMSFSPRGRAARQGECRAAGGAGARARSPSADQRSHGRGAVSAACPLDPGRAYASGSCNGRRACVMPPTATPIRHPHRNAHRSSPRTPTISYRFIFSSPVVARVLCVQAFPRHARRCAPGASDTHPKIPILRARPRRLRLVQATRHRHWRAADRTRCDARCRATLRRWRADRWRRGARNCALACGEHCEWRGRRAVARQRLRQ